MLDSLRLWLGEHKIFLAAFTLFTVITFIVAQSGTLLSLPTGAMVIAGAVIVMTYQEKTSG